MPTEEYRSPAQASALATGQHRSRADQITALALRLCGIAAAHVVRTDLDAASILGSATNSLFAEITPAMIQEWDQVLGSDERAIIDDTTVPTLAAQAMLQTPRIRFVARYSLAHAAGAPQTALWLWDSRPRTLTDDELAALDDLTGLASELWAAPAATPVAPEATATRNTVNRLHALLRNATDLVSINDSQGIVQYISPSVTRILGYHPDDLIGQNSFAFVHPDDLARIAHSFSARMRVGGASTSVQMRFRNKRGEWRMLEATSANMLDDPQIRGVLVNAQDITERTQAEAAHQASEARFQAIFSSAPVGIVAADREGQMVHVNPSLAALFGYAPAELIDQPITRLLPDKRPTGVNLQLIGRHRDNTPLPVEVSWSMVEHAGESLIIAFVIDIREQQRMELALRESEDRYRQLIELAPDAVLVIRNGIILFTNRAGYATVGATRAEDVIGHPFSDFLVSTQLSLANQRIAARLNGQEFEPLCYQIVALDGTIRQLEVTSAPMTYGGEPAMLLVARDVTERSAHDQLLRFQANVLGQLTEAVVAIDANEQITYLNTAAERYYGRTLAAMQGTMLKDLYTVEYLDENDETAARRAIQADGLWHGENRHLTADGRALIVDTAVVMLRADDGTPIGMFGVSRDITARKQIEERLHLLESVVIHANDAVLITSALPIDQPGPQILYVNAAFTHTTGYTQEEVIGQTPRILQGAGTERATLAQIRAALEQQVPIRVEVLNYTKTGQEIWLDLSIAPVRNAAGVTTHYIAIQRDITERRRLEAQLLQSQKLESIGRLTGGIAHDFNNLLTGISGYADLALADTVPNSALHGDLIELRHGIDRATELTRQLLLFARRQPVQQQRLQLNTVIVALEKLLRRLVPAGIALQIDLETQLPPVLLDRSQLEQVLVNLVINACDAMPDGGTISICTSVIAGATKADMAVRLTVTDTGSGMTAETQAHAFEPFFTTKAVGQGTGLGLSTVYGIVHQHGGSIQIASQRNEGTMMIIDLLALDGDSDQPASLEPRPMPQPGIETVLVVDDEPMIRDLVARMLRSAGYTVHTAEHGKAAIAFLQAQVTPTIQFVVTDVVMPEIDGRRLGAWLVAERPEIGVLYISGNPSLNHTNDDGKPLTPLLAKPFTPQALLTAVRDGIQHMRPA